jgi:peptide/nickel transport system substrate-binding protein
VRDPKIGVGAFVAQSNWFTTIDTPDKYSVVLQSDAPRPSVFDFFQLLNMVDKVTIEGPDALSKSVGTGPFTFVEWVQGDHYTMARNKNYWVSGRPYLDGIHMPVLKDPQALAAQFEGGALDAAISPELRDFVRLKDDPAYRGITNQVDGQVMITATNVLMTPWNDKRVRQAMSYAINRQRVVDVAQLGVGQVKSLPWPPGSPAYDPAKESTTTFDLDKAGALLKAAGQTSFDMDLYPFGLSAEPYAFAEIYQADLAKIGVKVNIIKLELAQWLDQVATNKKYRGMYIASDSRTEWQPITYFNISRAASPLLNNEGFQSDAYTNLVNTLAVAVDPAEQKKLYDDLNDTLLDECFFDVVCTSPSRIITRNNIQGIETPRLSGFTMTNTWIS